jgi:nitrate reductase NapA
MVGVKDGVVAAVKGDPKSPVNQGALCVKGYSLAFIQYGQDRLTRPLIRKKDGKYDKHGQLTYASWDEALDLIAYKAKAAIEAKGPSSVAMFGSGQWTVWEGYVASKLWKGGLKSNSLEVNARHCMASAVAGFMTTFGMDEPMGSYDDIQHADVFVLWGANMAEMHPVIWAKLAGRLRTHRSGFIVNLTTTSNLSSDLAEREILFTPQSDLAIANGIANLLVQEGKVNTEFVQQHLVFKSGKENIGYGLEDGFKFKDEPKASDFEAYKAYVAKYTPEYVQELSGVSPDDLKYLAGIYGDPNLKVMSFWTMGMNQHTRGTWINNLVYNLHLLTGKISSPGNQPFSLTGQPSACGTCREVGTFTHRLPADMVVANPKHREKTEQIWGVPAGTIPDKPSYHAIEMMRALDRGDVLFFWSSTTNPFQNYPNLNRFRAGAQKEGRFIVVSDIYPTLSTELADVVLPSAMWVEKEGAFGNTERRTQLWKKMVEPPGEARSDLWQFVEFAKRMGLGGLFAYDKKAYPVPTDRLPSDATLAAGLHLERAIWEEYRKFGTGHGHDLAPFEAYGPVRGLRWPVVDGKETVTRYREGDDPYVPAGKGVYFYGNKEATDGKAVVWLRPFEPAAEVPSPEYPLWLCTGRVLEHWHSGTMTRRVKELYKAYPHATANLHPDDAKRLGIQAGDGIRITSRRGSVDVVAEIGGRVTPQAGMVYVPWFDEDVMINRVTLDAYCPISGEADYKKCAVKIEKLG